MKGKYLVTDRCASFWVDCDILEYKVKQRKEHQSDIARLLDKELDDRLGAVITYEDEYYGKITVWTHLGRIKV